MRHLFRWCLVLFLLLAAVVAFFVLIMRFFGQEVAIGTAVCVAVLSLPFLPGKGK